MNRLLAAMSFLVACSAPPPRSGPLATQLNTLVAGLDEKCGSVSRNQESVPRPYPAASVQYPLRRCISHRGDTVVTFDTDPTGLVLGYELFWRVHPASHATDFDSAVADIIRKVGPPRPCNEPQVPVRLDRFERWQAKGYKIFASMIGNDRIMVVRTLGVLDESCTPPL